MHTGREMVGELLRFGVGGVVLSYLLHILSELWLIGVTWLITGVGHVSATTLWRNGACANTTFACRVTGFPDIFTTVLWRN